MWLKTCLKSEVDTVVCRKLGKYQSVMIYDRFTICINIDFVFGSVG